MVASARRGLWACACAVVALAAGCASASGAGLPDGRAYEMVSPPDKLGADVAADSQRVRAAADGSAVSFPSLGGFGDVHGTGQATEYLSERATSASPGANGWSTHNIFPQQDPLTSLEEVQGLDALWQGEFSADLSIGVFGALSPLTDEDPNVGAVLNLYRRTDMRIPGPGSYRLLTPCPACSGPFPASSLFLTPRLGGASADFNHVIFESALQLTSDASAATHVYEWVNGILRLVDVLPDSACGGPPCYAASSASGPGAPLGSPNVISADGSRIAFTDTSTGDGVSTGALYERVDGTSTVQVNASEKASPDAPQPATYQTASADGMREFFTTAEQLTDDDTNGIPDLYMWDAGGLPGHHLTLVSVDNHPSDGADPVQGVIGASSDGHYVYFVAAGQLVAGEPRPSLNAIFVWHDGSVNYIGELGNAGDLSSGSSDILGLSALGGGIRARVTPDGKHMAFMSHSGVGLLSAHGGIDYDQTQCANRRCAEFYVYSADSGALACATCDPDGTPATNDAETWIRNGGTGLSALHVTHSLSDDGRWFFFHTAEALVPGDSNGKSDAYEYDTETGTVRILSSGRDPSDSYFMDASASGRDAFFLTRERMTGWDSDGNYDLYDARVGGGFPDPSPSPATCTGDACKGALDAAPGVPVVGSATLRGLGNVRGTTSPKPKAKPKPKRCKKGSVRKRVRGKIRCVKKRTSRSARRTTAQRRAR